MDSSKYLDLIHAFYHGKGPNIYFRHQFQPTKASRTVEEFNTSFEEYWEQEWRDQVEGVAKAHHLRKDESIIFLYKLKKKLRKEAHGLYFEHLRKASEFPEPGFVPLGFPDCTTAEHNTGRPEDNIEVLMSGRRNLDPLSFEILSPPDGPEQNTGTLSSFAGPILSFRTNRMGKLVFVSSFNLVSSAMMATVNYFQNDLQGVHETFWKPQHIVSFGVPFVFSASTLLSSSLFASDPERWSNWITGLLSVNAGMIAGGPLAFYFMRNQGTKN